MEKGIVLKNTKKKTKMEIKQKNYSRILKKQEE